MFSWRGAFITSLAALACMLPRAIFFSAHPIDALFETSAVFIVGNVLAVSFVSLRKERERRAYFAALNQTSSVVSQSLELSDILNSSIDNVIDVMKVEVALVFLLDKEAGELVLAAHRGVSAEFVQGVGKLKLGEDSNSRVAETGEPLYVEDASRSPELTKMAVREEGIQSQLIVPLKSKGRVMGTLYVAARSQRQVLLEELELVTAIGNQIGVAVDNARLYQQQREVAEQLRVMQENLRFYLKQATRAQEEERKRIARELHDETVQSLVVLSRQLDTLASGDKGLSEDSRLHLEELRQQISDIMQSIRRLSHDLRPAALDRLGLLPALEWLASDVAEYSGIATKVNVLGTERRLPEEIELALFRIAQEAMRNMWRHSQATRTEITVEFGKSKTKITVRDNGKGFKIPKTMNDLARDGKLGLAGMQERAQLLGGSITAQSELGKGSSITVDIPA